LKVRRLTVSFSALDLYKSCPRKFELSHLLLPVEAPDESLLANFKGSVVHECIDAFHSGKSWLDKFVSMTEGKAICDIMPDKSGSLRHLEMLIKRYLDQYCTEPLKDRDFEVVRSEQMLEMSLSAAVTFRGKLDKIAIDKEGRRIIVDHKTSSSLRSWVAPTVAISDQFTGYIALGQANGLGVSGLLVDGISTARKALDDDKDLFCRYPAERTAEQIENWKQNTLAWCSQIVRDIESSEFLTNKPHACCAFGGKCLYYDICASTSSSATNIIRNSFTVVQNPWIERIEYEPS
jgi:hypothetical protein